MKKITVFLLLALTSVKFTAAQPDKQGVIKARLIYVSCASIVVEIMNPGYYYLGQDKWRHSSKEPEYEHVFAVRNSCEFLQNNLQEGDEFYFKVIRDSDYNDGCVQCLKYDSPPYARVSIEVIKKPFK